MAPQARDADSDGAQSDMLFIGDHCALGACMQLDFLPFVCNGCKKTYCLDHRGARSHDCPHAGALSGRGEDAGHGRLLLEVPTSRCCAPLTNATHCLTPGGAARHGRDGHRVPAVRGHVSRAAGRGREHSLRKARLELDPLHTGRLPVSDDQAEMWSAILLREARVQQLRHLQAVRPKDVPEAPLSRRPRMRISASCLRIWHCWCGCCGQTCTGGASAEARRRQGCTGAPNGVVSDLRLHLR